ncbi:unnamed protein product [Sordaria macrospora k-hell]|uniref:WGS project CABT00000000 data, contig 2.1 n=1 Tax=Sordaria macrospora (strain ATCC MYA-333 / DSM 997 / K(L3346) / K-hell) TaxID=771870 RepID=F7VLG8_SORMK|nr:uncharacterized protein SMAC_00561 [Sordaria macrospora k-hell]CCC06346.1 unnamed protein product [Sordaria macrospora k-hell]
MKLLTLLVAGAALPLISAAPASTAIVEDTSSVDADASVAATLALSTKTFTQPSAPQNVNEAPPEPSVPESPRPSSSYTARTSAARPGTRPPPFAKGRVPVILPEQLGFCKSTKPTQYTFDLEGLATNTRNLLKALGVTKPPIVIGHSLGGMLASRFALTYPEFTKSLVLVSPIGLEDWKQLGVPDRSFDLLANDEKTTTYASLRGYEQATYYPGAEWTEDFDKWVVMLTKVYEGDQKEKFWADQARVVEMVLGQPTIHEYKKIKPKTLLVIGEKDNTAIGKVWSPPEVQAKLGNYAVLGRKAQAAIPDATLVSFPYLGHAPQIQDPEMFNRILSSWVSDGGRSLGSLKLNATIIR